MHVSALWYLDYIIYCNVLVFSLGDKIEIRVKKKIAAERDRKDSSGSVVVLRSSRRVLYATFAPDKSSSRHGFSQVTKEARGLSIELRCAQDLDGP